MLTFDDVFQLDLLDDEQSAYAGEAWVDEAANTRQTVEDRL